MGVLRPERDGNGFTFFKEQRRVGVYYFYVLDPDFGPGFIKICTYFPVRHEAPFDRAVMKGHRRAACRSRPLKLEGSLTLEAQGRVGAAPTTPGRFGTARRAGSGKQDGTVYECRNQRWNPLKRIAGSNLVDRGRTAVGACRETAAGDTVPG